MTPKEQWIHENLRNGEIYAGIILGKGEPDYHLILLPGKLVNFQWEAAVYWSKTVSGNLPTRREQPLLLANAKDEFLENRYWSSEPHQTSYEHAWCQCFLDGEQHFIRKSSFLYARAVRRIYIKEQA